MQLDPYLARASPQMLNAALAGSYRGIIRGQEISSPTPNTQHVEAASPPWSAWWCKTVERNRPLRAMSFVRGQLSGKDETFTNAASRRISRVRQVMRPLAVRPTGK